MVRAPVETLTECLPTVHPTAPSSEWVPGGNTGEIKAASKGTEHPASHADSPG